MSEASAMQGVHAELGPEDIQAIKAELWGPAFEGEAELESMVPPKPLLVAKGDSWFDYPPGLDILDHLRRSHKYPITKLSHFGDTLENMVYGTEQNRDFSYPPSPLGTLVATVAKQQPFAVLFSGGGNDVAGDDLSTFLNHTFSGLPVLREAHLKDFVQGFARKAYERVAKAVWDAAPQALFVTHGYAYPEPDGRAVLNLPFGFRFGGPWLRPAFTRKRVEIVEARAIVRRIIDEFNVMLTDVAATSEGRFVHIDLREQVGQDEWVNELHLTSAAYGRVADEFHKRLST